MDLTSSQHKLPIRVRGNSESSLLVKESNKHEVNEIEQYRSRWCRDGEQNALQERNEGKGERKR